MLLDGKVCCHSNPFFPALAHAYTKTRDHMALQAPHFCCPHLCTEARSTFHPFSSCLPLLTICGDHAGREVAHVLPLWAKKGMWPITTFLPCPCSHSNRPHGLRTTQDETWGRKEHTPGLPLMSQQMWCASTSPCQAGCALCALRSSSLLEQPPCASLSLCDGSPSSNSNTSEEDLCCALDMMFFYC
jgi:hypothetical protein